MKVFKDGKVLGIARIKRNPSTGLYSEKTMVFFQERERVVSGRIIDVDFKVLKEERRENGVSDL